MAHMWRPGIPLDTVYGDLVCPETYGELSSYTTDALMVLISETTSYILEYQFTRRYESRNIPRLIRVRQKISAIIAAREDSANSMIMNLTQPAVEHLYPSSHVNHEFATSSYSEQNHKYAYAPAETAQSNSPLEASDTDDESDESDEFVESEEEEEPGLTDKESWRRRGAERKTKRHLSTREVESTHRSRRRHAKSQQRDSNEENEEKKGRSSKSRRSGGAKMREGQRSEKYEEPNDDEESGRVKHLRKTRKSGNSRHYSHAEDDSDHNPRHRSKHRDKSRDHGKGKGKAESKHGDPILPQQRSKRRPRDDKKSSRDASKRRGVSHSPKRSDDESDQSHSPHQQPPPKTRQNQNPKRTPQTSSEQSEPSSPKPFNPYSALGVSPETPSSRIKLVFSALLQRYHPDKLGGRPEAEVQKATERMAEINRARDVLMDAEKRMAYDLEGIVSELEFQAWLEEQKKTLREAA